MVATGWPPDLTLTFGSEDEKHHILEAFCSDQPTISPTGEGQTQVFQSE
jgi:hypothetical protein